MFLDYDSPIKFPIRFPITMASSPQQNHKRKELDTSSHNTAKKPKIERIRCSMCEKWIESSQETFTCEDQECGEVVHAKCSSKCDYPGCNFMDCPACEVKGGCNEFTYVEGIDGNNTSVYLCKCCKEYFMCDICHTNGTENVSAIGEYVLEVLEKCEECHSKICSDHQKFDEKTCKIQCTKCFAIM